eukprot:g6477.t1
MDELLLYPERAAPLANTSSYKSGVGLTILQDNLCESDFSENDGNSTVSDEMNRGDNSSRHKRTEDASIMSLSNEGVEYARQFAENMIHHFNANEPKIALTKIREAFEGTYNKKVEQESMIAGATLASLTISTEKDWCFSILQGRLIPYLKLYAKVENVENSPDSENTRFQRFTSICSIYTLFNLSYVNKCVNTLLLSNVVTEFCNYIIYPKPIQYNMSDKETIWLYTFCKYENQKSETNHIVLARNIDVEGIRPTAINIIAIDVVISISKYTSQWSSQSARFRFFLAGGFEALLIGATDDIRYKAATKLRQECLNCLKTYSLRDVLRFRSHCIYRNKPDSKIKQLYKLIVKEKKELGSIKNRKLELYKKAREDSGNRSLNLGTRLRAAKIRANVEINGTVDLLQLPRTKSKLILPCIDKFHTGYILPMSYFNQIKSEDEMHNILKLSELNAARSNAAQASADAYCIELKEYLTFEKEYKKRVQYENELEISKLLAESHRRRSNIALVRQKTVQALDLAIQFKFNNFNAIEKTRTKKTAGYDHVRNGIKQAELNVNYCQKGLKAAHILSRCVNDEIQFMHNQARIEQRNEMKNAQANVAFISRQYKFLKQESTNTKSLIIENEELVKALKEELAKARIEGRSSAKQDTQNRVIMLNHNNYLIDMKRELNKALSEMKQLKPFIAESELELKKLREAKILDFLTKDEREVWDILQYNKMIAEVTVAAASASLKEANYFLQAEKYKAKLFNNPLNHKNNEINYLLSQYTESLELSRTSSIKAGTAYGTLRHVRYVALLQKGKKEDVKTVQSKHGIQKYASQALLQCIKKQIEGLNWMPCGYAANPIFHQWGEAQQLILENQKQITELIYNIACGEGALGEAQYRLKKYFLQKSHTNSIENVDIQAHLNPSKTKQLDSLKGKVYVLAWELAFHRRNLACESYNQAVSIAMKKRIDITDVEHASHEEKRLIFDLRKKKKVRRICDEECANATHEKTAYEKNKPFATWKILGVNNNHSIMWKGSDQNELERMKQFFDRSIESNKMAHDCVFAIKDLEAECKELHKRARTTKTGLPSPFMKEQIRSANEKLSIFFHKLDRANWLYDMYHQLLKAQCSISFNRQIKKGIEDGTCTITKASIRRKKKEEAEQLISKHEVAVIRLNKEIGDYLDESNSKDEATLRAELERLRIARLVEEERLAKKLALEKKKHLDAMEAKRHKEIMIIEQKKKNEEAKILKRKLKEDKNREKERAKAAKEKKKQAEITRAREIEKEKIHIKKLQQQQKLRKMKENSQRALDKIEMHKQGQEISTKILKYVLTRIDSDIERIEAKKREERKRKMMYQKKMLRECKLWTEEYDESSGCVYYLNYRTHEQLWEIPECWVFKEKFETEQYEEQQAEQWSGHQQQYSYDQKYDDGTQQQTYNEYGEESEYYEEQTEPYYEGQTEGQQYYGDY